MKFKYLAGVVLVHSTLAFSQLTSAVSSPYSITYWETPEYYKSGALADINAAYAYSRGYTGKGSTIAVLDTGIANSALSSFGNRIILEQDFTNTGINDTNGHGTNVAGIAAASNNNPQGMEGVAFGANLMIGKISASGIISTTTVLNGLAWASTNKATVVNLSAETTAKLTTTDYQQWASALGNGQTVLVVSAGNQSLKTPTTGFGQLAIATDTNGKLYMGGRVLVVGNLATSGNILAGDSNYAGITSPYYIVAPGSNITSVSTSGGLSAMSGTSQAAATVSGAVAIINQMWPQMTGANIVQLLLQTADKVSCTTTIITNCIRNYNPAVYGQGLLDLNRATQPLGNLTIPTTGRNTPLASSAPILITSGSASLGKISGVMVLDSMNRDFYVNSSNFATHYTPYAFNGAQASMPYLTKNPYTQYNNYTNFVTTHIGNYELTMYRDTTKEANTDITPMVELAYNKKYDNSAVRVSMGSFIENGSWLGNYTGGYDQNSQSFTTFAGVALSTMLSNTTEFTASLYNGLTTTNSRSDYINNIGGILSYSWNLGLEQRLNENNRIGFMMYQPVTVYQAMANTNIPTGLDANYNTVYAANVNLAADVKELRAGIYYKFVNKNNNNLIAFVENRQNFMGINGSSINVAGFKANINF
jgi:hypothetical protein